MQVQASRPGAWRARALVRSLFLTSLTALVAAGVWQVPADFYLPFYLLSMVFYAGVAFGVMPTGLHLDRVLWLLDLTLLTGIVRFTGGVGSPFTPLAYLWVFGMLVVHFRRGLHLPVVYFSGSALLALAVATAGSEGWLAYLAAQTAVLALTTLVGAELLKERSRREFDPLTGALTRSAGLELLVDLQERGQVFNLAFVDLRDFKGVNDRYGHRAGDEVLAALGRRLKSMVRPEDLVIRYGGDEFVVASTATAWRIGERLARKLEEPITTYAGPVTLRADVGEMQWQPGTPLDTILHEADAKMYGHKGRRLDGTNAAPAAQSAEPSRHAG